jgi:DNA helicase-2/ATP-dependent DNA helicase PcrA
MQFEPSTYQKEIFDFITQKSGNAVINAKAGSGKTTTLVESMKLVPSKEKVLFVAFNKAIEQDLRNRLTDYKNVDVRTYHGLGYAILRENINKKIDITVSEHKYLSYINKIIGNKQLHGNELRQYKTNLKTLVDFARYNLAQSNSEIKKLCKKYSITPILDEVQVVPAILEWGKQHLEEIDYTDMIWLCVELGFKTKMHKADFIFIDEAQDSSIVQQTLIKKCYKRGTRFIAIGDEFQCINAFAGADQEAFRKFTKERNTVILDLPITYRCPNKIIKYVNEVTGVKMLPSPHAVEGNINFDVSPYEPKNNDMVLCRNTAHLVKLYMRYNKVNKNSYLKGRNIGETFKTIVLQTHRDYLSNEMICDGVFPQLYKNLFDTIDKEMALTGLDYEDVINTNKINDMIDTIKALSALSEGIVRTDELINKINTIFSDDEEDGICLSTIHKAKGLEADNVYILCNSLMPSKFAKKSWEIESEKNLIYVAMTRAKKSLNYISEKLFPVNMFDENGTLLEELEIQRTRMNNALNIESVVRANEHLTQNERIAHDVHKIKNIQSTNMINKNTKKKNNIGGNKFSKFL